MDDLIIIPLGISLAIKMVPKKILDECRAQANEQYKAGKPKNWIAGGIIIVLWLLVVLWIVLKILGR